MNITEEERHDYRIKFLARCLPMSGDQCWEWKGTRNDKGYGLMTVHGHQERAHRVAWTLWRGPIPEGLFILHRCDNPGCVNIRHLFLGNQRENLADMRAKARGFTPFRGQIQVGTLNRYAKLNDDTVRLIRHRRQKGALQRELAVEFGVDRATISYVLSGRTWSHVK